MGMETKITKAMGSFVEDCLYLVIDYDDHYLQPFASGYLAGVVCDIVSHPADSLVSQLASGKASPWALSLTKLAEVLFSGVSTYNQFRKKSSKKISSKVTTRLNYGLGSVREI